MHVFVAWTRARAVAITDPPPTDAVRAIEIAEQFVHDNGYADFSPPDPIKLVPESIEFQDR